MTSQLKLLRTTEQTKRTESTFIIISRIAYYTNGTIFNETYYYAGGTLVAKRDNNGILTFNHPDHLGSTTLVTNSSGNEIEEEFYLPFGGILEGGEDSRYLFTGKERDKTTNLDYFGARYYDSELRHFVQADSVIADLYNPQNLNHYSYVLNNPYKYVDESGEYVETVFDIAFIAYDIQQIQQDPDNAINYIALGADVAGAALPGVTGLGIGVKAGANALNKIDNVLDSGKAGENEILLVEQPNPWELVGLIQDLKAENKELKAEICLKDSSYSFC